MAGPEWRHSSFSSGGWEANLIEDLTSPHTLLLGGKSKAQRGWITCLGHTVPRGRTGLHCPLEAQKSVKPNGFSCLLSLAEPSHTVLTSWKRALLPCVPSWRESVQHFPVTFGVSGSFRDALCHVEDVAPFSGFPKVFLVNGCGIASGTFYSCWDYHILFLHSLRHHFVKYFSVPSPTF